MLLILTVVFSVIVLLGTFIQLIAITNFSRQVSRPARTPIADDQCKPVAVLLSLRGGDPFLKDCLSQLVQQDYPDYEIIVAFDNENDPAVEYVNRLIDEGKTQHLTTKIITERRNSCTLACNNYAQLVDEIDPRFEFVTFVDADAVTWPGWLRALVQPLIEDDEIGASSGNRWYTPKESTLGNMVRSFWNMGSVIQMALYGHPWGGSLVMRTDIAKSDEMLDRWRTSFSPDATVTNVLKTAGKKFYFNPKILLQNEESTTLSDLSNWIPRQLLQGKLYHPKWIPIVIQAILLAVIVFGALVTNFTNLFQGNWTSFCILGSSLLFAWITTCLLFIQLNHSIVTSHGKMIDESPTRWLTMKNSWQLLHVSLITIWIYTVAICRVQFISRVEWRGIVYRIRDRFDIEMEEYKPFTQVVGDSNQSL